jgi:glycosyltransferase involved in cell wall biosynthesis
MKGACVFVAQGFRRENISLQPWRYLFELARRFSDTQDVVVITDLEKGDEDAEEEWTSAFVVRRTKFLSVVRQAGLASLIRGYAAERVWWSTTPRSIVYFPAVRRLLCPVTAVVTCPLYSWEILVRAILGGVPYRELRVLLHQRCIPRWFFARFLSAPQITRVIAQSHANRQLMVNAGVSPQKVTLLPVGLDSTDTVPVSAQEVEGARREFGCPPGAVVFLYPSAARSIRGINALLRAFPLVTERSPDAFLVLLARGSNMGNCEKLLAACKLRGIGERVTVIGGWLSRRRLAASIDACDVVVLPFVLAPSDVPIAVLEAMARGKPVISSPVDGIPELVQGRGVLVDPLDKKALAAAMLKCAGSRGYRQDVGRLARQFMNSYPDWDEIGRRAAAANE